MTTTPNPDALTRVTVRSGADTVARITISESAASSVYGVRERRGEMQVVHDYSTGDAWALVTGSSRVATYDGSRLGTSWVEIETALAAIPGASA